MYFGNQTLIYYKTVCRIAEGIGKEMPRDKSTKGKDGIRDTVGRDFDQKSEKNAEYEHDQQGLKQYPAKTEQSLFISDLQIPPSQEIQETASLPQRTKIEWIGSVGWPYKNLFALHQRLIRAATNLRHRGFWEFYRRVAEVSLTLFR
jgi:hypothetical protein